MSERTRIPQAVKTGLMAATMAMIVGWIICDWLEVEWARQSNLIVSVPYFGAACLLTLATLYVWWLDSLKAPSPGNTVLLRQRRLSRRVGRVVFPLIALTMSVMLLGMVFKLWDARTQMGGGFPPFLASALHWMIGAAVASAVGGIAAIVLLRPRSEPPSRCAACRYDCTGIPSAGVCPECGNSLT